MNSHNLTAACNRVGAQMKLIAAHDAAEAMTICMAHTCVMLTILDLKAEDRDEYDDMVREMLGIAQHYVDIQRAAREKRGV